MAEEINVLIQKAYKNFQDKKEDAAIDILKKILLINPLNFDANHMLGVILGIQGQPKLAKTFLKKSVEIDPKNYFASYNYAKSLVDSGEYIEGIFYSENAIKIDPKNKEAWINYGVNLKKLKFYSKSIECYEKALTIDPDYLEALVNKSDILIIEKKFNEALIVLDRALLIDFSKKDIELVATTWINRGVAFLGLGKSEDALVSFNKAIDINSNDPEAWFNKGVTLQNLKRYDEAEHHYDQAIKLKPDYTEAYFNKATKKLILGDFKNGWNLYQYRWKNKDFEEYRYPQFKKLESVNNLENKKILIWHEQGMGDSIQFSRYIPKLINLGAIITFVIQKDLVPFFRTQFKCEITDKVSINENFDYETPLLNLPYVFKTSIATIPANQAYLKVKTEEIIDWKKKIKLLKNKLNIGIAISGNPNHKDNHIRSIPLENMESLFQQANFFIIQKELSVMDMVILKKYPEIKFMGEEIVNFSDTAAIVENMDLIISIDTSLIHLAGALGKRAFLMLSWSSEWRWLLERNETPWYKSIKIFRQKSAGDWYSVINEIEFELKKSKSRYV
jgi:tetratricopeptide (TPR) repeat protein